MRRRKKDFLNEYFMICELEDVPCLHTAFVTREEQSPTDFHCAMGHGEPWQWFCSFYTNAPRKMHQHILERLSRSEVCVKPSQPANWPRLVRCESMWLNKCSLKWPIWKIFEALQRICEFVVFLHESYGCDLRITCVSSLLLECYWLLFRI